MSEPNSDGPNMDLIKNIDYDNLPKGMKKIDLSGEPEKGRCNFVLRPRAVMYPMVQDTTEKPQKHEKFIIINCGKAEILAQLEYGNRKEKLGNITECILKPGEETALEPGDEHYEVTTVRITNSTYVRAAFQMEGGESILPKGAGEHYQELLDPIEGTCVDVPLDGKTRKIEIDSPNEAKEDDKLTITDVTNVENDNAVPAETTIDVERNYN